MQKNISILLYNYVKDFLIALTKHIFKILKCGNSYNLEKTV
ncbi:hypothetical protein LEP1GSC115_3415 [Leptospira interrogans serovar Australis str. 200703203]|uniref:Uncharacterized protein n=1 Tax=Leptospira interrogans serovar Australis str. 200703203 TaxID=1085541 RepID=N1UJU5_LEPIR|nr:hypothetical protein LEP1GSC115_3415 [Leptospira interrogans serovar Australis str. 200703203]